MPKLFAGSLLLSQRGCELKLGLCVCKAAECVFVCVCDAVVKCFVCPLMMEYALSGF